MYRCEKCGSLVGPRVPAHRVAVETRVASYPRREKANAVWKCGKRELVDDPGGVGTEIVREATVCATCATLSRSAISVVSRASAAG